MEESRITDKAREIEIYLNDLNEIIPETFEAYIQDRKTKAACERNFEKIVEACVDLAFLALREKNLKVPEGDKEAFDTLAVERIIPLELAKKLRDAKGMRNIIAHQYGKVDDEIVFNSITGELIEDVNRFLKEIRKLLIK